MNDALRIAALEEDNERLRERVQTLEDALGITPFLTPVEWRLTGSETRLFGHLLARDVATKASIMSALYEPGVNDEPEIKIVDVFVCKLRKKLAPFGIEIATLWGMGYRMTAEAKDKARALISPTPAGTAAVDRALQDAGVTL